MHERPRSAARGAAMGLALLATGAAAAAPEPLPAFKAVYDLSRNGTVVASVERRLRREGNGWVFESVTEPRGMLSAMVSDRVEETSRWVYGDDGSVIPMRYSYHRAGGLSERHAVLEFDWQRGTVLNRVQNQPWVMSIPEGTQDKLGYQLALMLDLARGVRPLAYPVADGGRLKYYELADLGQERVATPMGNLRSIKVRRTRKQTRVTTLWCAQELAYLPVKVTHLERDGTLFTMTVRSLEGLSG